MEKIDILIWVIGIGFSFNFSLMIIIWNRLNKRIDKLDEKITDIDRCLCRMEGAFSAKECCALKAESTHRRVE